MNPYFVLGVDKTATPAEIKIAYRRLCASMHPDAGGGADEFRVLVRARDILLDADRRAAFDATGSVEDAKPENHLRGTALQLIIAVLDQVLIKIVENRADPAQYDLITMTRNRLMECQTEARREIHETVNKATAIERLAIRFKRKKVKDAPDVTGIRELMLAQAAELRRRAAFLASEFAQFQIALDELSQHGFEMDAPPPPMRGIMLPPGSSNLNQTAYAQDRIFYPSQR